MDDELYLDIEVSITTPSDKEHATGSAKREVIDRIDRALDQELTVERAWEVEGDTVMAPAQDLLRRSYHMEAKSVRVRVRFDPRKQAHNIDQLAREHASRQENHWLVRTTNRILKAMFSHADEVIENSKIKVIEQLRYEYSRSIAQQALARCAEIVAQKRLDLEPGQSIG